MSAAWDQLRDVLQIQIEVWRYGAVRCEAFASIVDDFSRENLVLTADTSLSGHRVVRELDRVIAECGMPNTIVSDNGTEFTSMAILK